MENINLITLMHASRGLTASEGGYNLSELIRLSGVPKGAKRDGCIAIINRQLSPQQKIQLEKLKEQDFTEKAHDRHLLSVRPDSQAASKQSYERAAKRAYKRKRDLALYQEEHPDEDHAENSMQEGILKNARINSLIKEAKEKLLRYKTSNRRPGSYDYDSYIPAPESDQDQEPDPNILYTMYKDIDQVNEQEGPVVLVQQAADIAFLRKKIKNLYKLIPRNAIVY